MIVNIKNLRIKTVIGIHPWEKDIDRELRLNIKIFCDDCNATKSDEINDTIDYDVITNKVRNIVKNNKFNLIEKLAKTLMDAILEDEKISRCIIEVDKMNVFEDVDSFSVILDSSF